MGLQQAFRKIPEPNLYLGFNFTPNVTIAWMIKISFNIIESRQRAFIYSVKYTPGCLEKKLQNKYFAFFNSFIISKQHVFYRAFFKFVFFRVATCFFKFFSEFLSGF